MKKSVRSDASNIETIVILHSSDDLYGADRILLQVLNGMDPKRFRPVVVLPDDMKHVGLLSAKLAELNIEYLHLPILIVRRRYLQPRMLPTLVGRALKGTLAVRRLVRESNARLIYGFTFAVIAAPLAALAAGRPLVMHAHELLVRPDWLRRSLHALFVRRAQAVICISEAVRENILRDEPNAGSKLRTVHNGLESRSLPSKSPEEARAELQLPAGVPVIGMVGRISAWKGQRLLL
ncbi:MAG: glycosyltransferase, partial [Alloacidobacterium sp.]